MLGAERPASPQEQANVDVLDMLERMWREVIQYERNQSLRQTFERMLEIARRRVDHGA